MNRTTFAIGLATAGLFPVTTANAATSEQTTVPIVLGYYPSWEHKNYAPETLDYTPFTHLCHAFILPQADGSLKTEGNMPSKSLCASAHAKGVKVLVSLGGADSNDRFTSMTATAATKSTFVKNVIDVIDANGYDGLDLDWEVPRTTTTMHAMTDLADSFRAEFDKQPGERKLITIALSGSPWSMEFVDARALRKSVDFVNIMAYDVHGKWSDHGSHNAPLLQNNDTDRPDCEIGTGKAMVEHFRKKGGWPADRLVLGIPLYGREFAAAKPGDKIDKSITTNEYIPVKGISDYFDKGWVRHYDAGAAVPWLASKEGKTFISYEDTVSARAKGEWAKQQKLGGVMFWEITQDAPGLPTVNAARNGLLDLK